MFRKPPGLAGVYSSAERRARMAVRVTSAAAVGAGVAALQLLEVKLPSGQSGACAGRSGNRAEILLVGGVAGPFAKAPPESPHAAPRNFLHRHQSSPCASPWTTPVKSA